MRIRICLMIIVLMMIGTFTQNVILGAPKIEIEIWGWSQSLKALSSNIPEFKKLHPNVEFKIVELPQAEHHMKLLTTIVGRKGGPDIALLEGLYSNRYAGKGLLDLTNELKPYRNHFPEVKWGEAYANGRQYGVPFDIGPMCVYYRADLFEQAGLNPSVDAFPKTWDEMRAAGRKLREKGIYLFSWDYSQVITLSFYYFRPMLLQLGSSYYDKNGMVLLGNTESIRVAKLLYDMVNVDKIVETDTLYRKPAWFSQIKAGKIAAVYGAAWMAGVIKDGFPETAGKWRIAPIPAFDPGGPRVSNAGGTTVSILQSSKNQKIAFEFLKFSLLTKEGPVRMYKEAGIFPAYQPSYVDPIFDQPDPFFGGQKVMRIWADLTKGIPAYYYTPTSVEDDYKVNAILIDILQNKTSIENGLQMANEQITEALKNVR